MLQTKRVFTPFLNNLNKLIKCSFNFWLKIFFNLLGLIIPFNDLKKIYLSHISKNPITINKRCNHSLKLWLYQLELSYKTSIDNLCLCFKKTCLNIEKYKVGCKNNTCRQSK